MEKILFVVLFIMIIVLIYAVYRIKDIGTHKDETDSKVQGCEAEKKIETPNNEEDTLSNTGGY